MSNSPGIKRQQYQESVQDLENQSFDPNHKVLVRGIVAENPSGGLDLLETDGGGNLKTSDTLGKLVPKDFDSVEITTYNANDDPTEVKYYTGGVGGTLVSTLTLVYDVSNRFTSASRVDA